MRLINLMILVAVVAGCSTVSDVPLPKTTPYDSKPEARSAYLEGYRNGYDCRIHGGASFGPDVFSADVIAKARMYGWYDGSQAAEVVLEREKRNQRALMEQKTE